MGNTINKEEKMVSKSKINVRYAETDKMGIVHHSVYPIWYEVARTDLCREIGFTYAKMEKEGVMTPLVGLECKYIRPAYYDDDLEVQAKIRKLTPARIEFYYEVYNCKDKSLLNTGITTHAIVGKELKPINLKKHHPEIWEILSKIVEN